MKHRFIGIILVACLILSSFSFAVAEEFEEDIKLSSPDSVIDYITFDDFNNLLYNFLGYAPLVTVDIQYSDYSDSSIQIHFEDGITTFPVYINRETYEVWVPEAQANLCFSTMIYKNISLFKDKQIALYEQTDEYGETVYSYQDRVFVKFDENEQPYVYFEDGAQIYYTLYNWTWINETLIVDGNEISQYSYDYSIESIFY
jgi:hypothetical protein